MSTNIKDRYITTLVSGYALMAMQILLSLATIPLALKYLGKENFGIWALCAQVAAWLQLLDAGMNGAVARHLIDYQQDRSGEGLGHCISTGFRVLFAQGILILAAAFCMGHMGGFLFNLNAGESAVFGDVLLILGVTTFLGFASKILPSWLYATQRLDLGNLVALGTILLEFLLFWLFLKAGWGLYSLAWARGISSAAGVILHWWFTVHVAGFPVHHLRGPWNTSMFKKLATFGGGMFLLTLGTQLLTMTQTALVANALGLAAAAVWATAPKLFQVALQAVSKLWDYRIPHLSAFMASDQKESLTRSFFGLFRATAYIGGGGLGAIVALNPAFLEVWTHGTIHWDHINDWLIGLAFYLGLLIRCFTDFVLHTKKIGWMPFLMVCEGLMFVSAARWLLPHYGIPGMLLSSLVAGGLLRLPYSWSSFRSYLLVDGQQSIDLAVTALGGAALGLFLHFILSLIQQQLPPLSMWLSLGIQGTVVSAILGPIALKLILDSQRAPILGRVGTCK